MKIQLLVPATYLYSYAKRWALNGKLHRLDGPAVIYHDGRIFCWKNGREYALDKSHFAV